MYRVICDRKQEFFTLKIGMQIIAHEHETRCRVNNKLVFPRYTKSICQNALIFRGIRLWSTTPNDVKPSPNLTRVKKYLKRFLLNNSGNPYCFKDCMLEFFLRMLLEKVGVDGLELSFLVQCRKFDV